MSEFDGTITKKSVWKNGKGEFAAFEETQGDFWKFGISSAQIGEKVHVIWIKKPLGNSKTQDQHITDMVCAGETQQSLKPKTAEFPEHDTPMETMVTLVKQAESIVDLQKRVSKLEVIIADINTKQMLQNNTRGTK